MIISKIKKFLLDNKLLSVQNTYLIAFSAGVDSLCLLHAMRKLRFKYSFDIVALHINHQWREEESLNDEKFAIEICKKYKIPLVVKRFSGDIPRTEDAARNERYKIFNEVAKHHFIDYIVTAHNKSDQVETILYRIIKGTGFVGLKGIPPTRHQKNAPTIIRPMLDCYRNEIEEYITRNDLTPRIDSSNFNQDFLRNRIRHSLLPELSTYNSKIEEALLRLSSISKQNEKIIDKVLLPIEEKIFIDDQTISREGFVTLPREIKSRMIMKLLVLNDIECSYFLVERLLRYVENTKHDSKGIKYSLVRDLFFNITDKVLQIVKREEILKYTTMSLVNIPGLTVNEELKIVLKVIDIKDYHNKIVKYPDSDSYKAIVDLSRIAGEIMLRTRREGDIVTPIGFNGTMKLRKYLMNKKVVQFQKDLLPVLAYKNDVLWVVGVGLSDRIKVVDKPTHVLEMIRY